MENHGQKRSADEQLDLLKGVKTILLDIEGTVTPLTFVKDTLFPYVRDNVKSYLQSHYEEAECQQDVEALRQQATKDKEASLEGVVEIPAKEDGNQEDVITAAVANVLWQMDACRTTTALKELQGHVWREAYKTNKLQSEVFADVATALNTWQKQEKKVYTYTSCSVEGQKLTFGYSKQGDLQEKLAGYFDNTVGPTVEKDSFAAIAKQLEANPEDIAYVTDEPCEATAAGAAGLKTCVVVREGNNPLTDDDKMKFNTISSFCELLGEDAQASDAKKQEAEPSKEAPEVQEVGDDEEEEEEGREDGEEEEEEEEEEGGEGA